MWQASTSTFNGLNGPGIFTGTSYELKDHLGNVRSVLRDVQSAMLSGATITNDAIVTAHYNYYPLRQAQCTAFGMPMPGRYSPMGVNGYRYGFNGKEKDDDMAGTTGAMYDYGFRIYDARIAKFLSVDPLTKSYPWYTPYQFAGNTPIWAIDLDGAEPKYSNSVLTDYKYWGKVKCATFGAYDVEQNINYQCRRYFDYYGKGKHLDQYYNSSRGSWDNNPNESYRRTADATEASVGISNGKGWVSDFQDGVRQNLTGLKIAEVTLNITADIALGGIGSGASIAYGSGSKILKNTIGAISDFGNQALNQVLYEGSFDIKEINLTSIGFNLLGANSFFTGVGGSYGKLTLNGGINYSQKGAFRDATIDAILNTAGEAITNKVDNWVTSKGDFSSQMIFNSSVNITTDFIGNNASSALKEDINK